MTPTDANQETILIAETDMLVRHELAEYLRECGYKVLEAANPDEARLLISNNQRIDILLADAQNGGFELASWTRKHHPDIQTILAGTLTKTIENAGTLCEDSPTLTKPYNHQLILTHIRRLLANRQRNRE
jgi:DNA-binding NtrC family response regulator